RHRRRIKQIPAPPVAAGQVRGGERVKVNNAISGGFFILLAGLVFYLTKDFRQMPGQNYGAAFFPRTIASAMALLGLILVIQTFASRVREPLVVMGDWVRSPRHIANFALIVAVLLFYIL